MASARPMSRKIGVVIAGLAGVLWGVLSVTRVLLTGEADLPTRDAPADEIISYYEGLSVDAAFVIGVGMVTIGWALLLVFIAMVADLIGLIDRDLRWVGLLVLAGATVGEGVVVTYLAVLRAGAYWATHGGLETDAYLVLHGVSAGVLWVDSILSGLWLIPLGVVIIVTRLFPTWLGWAILATVVGQVAGFFVPVQAIELVAGGLPYLWILIAGALMLARSERYAPVVADAPVAQQ